MAPDALIIFTRLAVNQDQIEAYSLPTRPTKRTDTRAAGFVGESVELDAMPAPALRQLVERAIAGHINLEALKQEFRLEREDRQVLRQMTESRR